MRRAVAAGLVLVVVLTACGRGRADPAPTPTAAATHELTVTVDGRERNYRVYTPAGATTGRPVVVFLHGGGGTGELFQRVSSMDRVADKGGFVVVYPDGTGRLGDKLLTWNAGDCCAYAKEQNVDDVGFVRVLIDDVTARFGTGRVFVTGFSNGAMMTYRLGCELADRIAGIAVVSGAMNLDTCTPSRRLPVLIIHGTADTAVPYDGGPSSSEFPTAGTWTNRSVRYAVDFWTKHNGCGPVPAEARDGEVTEQTYTCAEPVTVYTVDGGGHGWPGGKKARPNAVEEAPPRPDASAVIWAFFAQA
jgi:polyhydroxybutyrate depolymerase